MHMNRLSASKANQHRLLNNLNDGFVIVYCLDVTGHVPTLGATSEPWADGCIAFDVEGNQWRATGRQWIQIYKKEPAQCAA